MRSYTQLVLLASAGDRVVTDADVRRVGVHPATFARWLDEGLWRRIAPGRYVHAATAPTFELQVRAGADWFGRRAALHGTSALAWLGLTDEPHSPEWLVPREHRGPAWVCVHTTLRWDNGDVVTVRGVRCCTAARAIIDSAARRPSAGELETLIERAISSRLTSLPTLHRRLAALSGPGRHGVPLVRELLLDSGGESHLERRFLRLLRTAGVQRPTTQVAFRSDGTTVARVDFLFRTHGVVVEVTGRIGHSSDSARQRDARRRNDLQQRGLVVLEFTTADVIDTPEYVLSSLRTSGIT